MGICIEALDNFTKKSFEGFSGPVEKFVQKNIIFGYNGRGKSSLALGVVEAYLQKNPESNKYRFFNAEYVQKNLLIEDNSSKIKGVNVVFGQKDIRKEEEKKQLSRDIISLQESERIDKSEIAILDNQVREIINSIHDTKKGDLKIKKKSQTDSLANIEKYFKNDLLKARNFENNDGKLRNYQGNQQIQKDYEYFDNYVFPNLKNIEIDVLEVNNILVASYNNLPIPTSQVVDWIKQGIDIHDGESNCKFCGNSINSEEIKLKLDSYQQDEKQKALKFLEDQNKILNATVNELKNFIDKKEELKIYLDEKFITDATVSFEELVKQFELIMDILNQKIADMNKIFQLDYIGFKNCIQTFGELKQSFESQKLQKKEKLYTLSNNQEVLVKGAIAMAVFESEAIKQKRKELTRKNEELSEKQKQISEKTKVLKEIEASESNYSDFANMFNNIFASIGIDLQLVIEDKSYVLKHSKTEDELTIQHISEGEKNLLALLYFYCELYQDESQENFKSDIELVVIDDPVSSFDAANRFYVLELVKKILSENHPQFFVLTHDWNDFTHLTYGLKSGNTKSGKRNEYQFFEVYKLTNGTSNVRTVNNATRPYKKLFQEIYDLSQKNIDEVNDCDIYHTPNSMRRVFEEFLSFKSTNGIIPQANKERQINDIYEKASNRKLKVHEKRKLSVLLKLINVLSHNARYERQEICDSAKFLIELIKAMDIVHFHAMIEQ